MMAVAESKLSDSLSCELNQLLFSWDTSFARQVTEKEAVIIQTWYVADIFMKISDMEPCFKENKYSFHCQW